MTSSFVRFGVVGGGAWGTALAQLLAADGAPVRLWAREEEVVQAINTQHRNPRPDLSCPTRRSRPR